MSTLNHQIETGLRWAVIRQIITGITSTVAVLAYRRILPPEVVGQFTLAFIVYTGLLLLIQIPIRNAVVYFREDEAQYSSAGFWLLLAVSIPAVIVVMFAADPLAIWYQFPQTAGLTRGMAIAFFFQALAVVPGALLLRHFKFFAHEMALMTAEVAFSIAMITLLLLDFGVESLMIAWVIRSFFWAVGAWWVTGFRPQKGIPRHFYTHIIRYGSSLLGSQFIIYLNRNIDNAAVGRLGDRELGLYGLAENQSSFVIAGVGIPLGQITLPALAAVQDNPAEFRRTYLDMLRLVGTISNPSHIGSFVLASLLILVFFGEQWLPAAAAMQAYLIYRILHVYLEITDVALSAAGRPDIRFKADLLQLPLFIVGTWFSVWVWGTVLGVAITLAAVRTFVGLIYLIASLPLTHITFTDLWRTLWPSTLAAMLMGGLVYSLPLLGIIPPADLSTPLGRTILTFVLLILSGVIFYFPLLYLLDPSGTKKTAYTVWHIILPEALRGRLTNWWHRIRER